MRTSLAWRLNRLYPAASSAAPRCSTVVSLNGSTEWIRNGSMMMRQRSIGARIGAPSVRRPSPWLAADAVPDPTGEAVVQRGAEAVGHVEDPAGNVRPTID